MPSPAGENAVVGVTMMNLPSPEIVRSTGAGGVTVTLIEDESRMASWVLPFCRTRSVKASGWLGSIEAGGVDRSAPNAVVKRSVAPSPGSPSPAVVVQRGSFCAEGRRQ